MKKCASCTKDLPDAALHCVFCGAKQPPAPATNAGLAKTVMGSYSAGDVMEQLKNQANPAAGMRAPAPSPNPPPQAQPAYAQPTQVPQPPAPQPPHQALGHAQTAWAPPPGQVAAPAVAPYQPPPPPAQPQYGGSGPVPAAHAAAPTLFVANNPPPAARPAPSPSSPAPMSMPVVHQPAPPPVYQPPPPAYQPPVAAPIATASTPYRTAPRAQRPVEPWKDPLRTQMYLWGALLIAAFATPLSLDPLAFNWDAILHAPGTAKVVPLVIVAVGLLSIAFAFTPLATAGRGLLAVVLGLAGIAVPIVLAGIPPWQALVPAAGMIVLLPSLIARSAYTDSIVPRLLVTLGVGASLLPYLMPVNDTLPIVSLFKAAIDAPGSLKVLVLLQLGMITILVLSLLAWLPSPSTGGAKLFAWLLILWPAIMLLVAVLLSGNIVDVATTQPGVLLAWVPGLTAGAGEGSMAAAASLGFGAAYAALVAYGGATVIGKTLE